MLSRHNEIERFTVGAGESAHTVVFSFSDDSRHLDPTDTDYDETWAGFQFVVFDRKSTLTDRHEFDTLDDVLDHIKAEGDAVIAFPMYGYRHSDVSYQIGETGNPFSCKFDSGFAGFVLVDRAWAQANLRKDQPFDSVVLENAKLFVEAVTNWCNGTAYEFHILDADGDRISDMDEGGAVLGYVDEDARQQAKAVAMTYVTEKLAALSSEALACRDTIASNRRAALALLGARRKTPSAMAMPEIADAIRTNVRSYIASICNARDRLKELTA